MAAHIDPDMSELLSDLPTNARQERRELVQWLISRGFDIDQIRTALSPILLATNRILGDDGMLRSSREVAESSGAALDLIQQLHRAVGLAGSDDADARVHSRADAESVIPAARLVDLGLDAQQVILAVRLLMDGFRHAAITMRRAGLQALLHPGTTELGLAQAFEALMADAEPLLSPMVDGLFRLALRQFLETEAINAAERTAGVLPGARPIAVAFADLVGFTRLGEALPPDELGVVAVQLSDLTHDLVQSPVQFVKAIGDAVMLVSSNPHILLTTLLDLVEAAAAASLPRLRVGMAFGPAVGRGGDWYGSPVNLASRVTGAAEPATVLVAESARTAIGDVAGIEFGALQQRYLKGISGEVQLFRAQKVAAPTSRQRRTHRG